MHELVIDFAALRTSSAQVAKHIEQFDAHLTELSGVVGRTGEVWEGEASQAYLARQQEWFEAAADLRSLLHDVRSLILTTHDNHARAMARNTAIWRNA
jgi:early secretory antigenic target protein ESAT-6